MLTGPQQMPVFSDEVLTPEDKRAIIGYLNALHERPADGGLALGGLGPVSEGLWAWIIGLGGLVCFAIWIAAKGSESEMSDDTSHGQPGTEVAPVGEEARYPVPDPGLEEHLPRLTDVDERAADRATRQVATFFGLVPVLSSVSLSSISLCLETWSSTSARCEPTPETSSSA